MHLLAGNGEDLPDQLEVRRRDFFQRDPAHATPDVGHIQRMQAGAAARSHLGVTPSDRFLPSAGKQGSIDVPPWHDGRRWICFELLDQSGQQALI